MLLAKRNLVVALCLATFTANLQVSWARGGGGGGARAGGFGGDFRGGDYRAPYEGDYRGGLDRGGDWGNTRAPFDQGAARPDAFNSARPSEAALQAGANRSYNWPTTNHTLSTDGGFGRLSSDTGTARISPADLATRGDAVRDAYRNPGAFDRAWWANHPGAWGWGGWGDGWAWGGTDWPALAGWWGVPVASEPTEYDYGNNISYQGDDVYYGSQPVESTETYYSQAQTLAESAPAIPATSTHSAALSKSWKSLGVFSLVQGDQTSTSTMFQLAVNKQGTIKGNYYNALTGEVQPVTGAIDKKKMRAAWTVGTNKNVVYDTGLANLLQNQSPVLVHFGKSSTQQWTLVKLQQAKKTS